MKTNTSKVTLSGIKHAVFASEETNCFSATVLINGKKVGTVSNEGRGGSDKFYPNSLQDELDAIAACMPPLDTQYKLPNDAELLIALLFEEWLAEKEFKRDLKKHFLFTKSDGKVYMIKAKSTEALAKALLDGHEVLKARINGAVEVLNCLPYADALELYKDGTSSRSISV